MCKANDKNGQQHNDARYNGVVDIAGRVMEPEYKRNDCYCERCQMRRCQKFGRWCNECFEVLDAERRFDWADMTNAQFEHYARVSR